jgi:hypothetical protein
MQEAKSLFDELAAASRPMSLEDFNLYVFSGLRGEFKDLVTSLITKAEPLLYVDLHNHLFTHEFLHKNYYIFNDIMYEEKRYMTLLLEWKMVKV